MQDSPRQFRVVLFVLLAFVVAFTVADIIEDLVDQPTALHLACELGVVVASTSAMAWLVLEALRQRRHLACLVGNLETAHADAAHWRGEAQQALSGLSAAIDAQLEAWRLTAAEREIGMLLLKGLALKEIATVRGTSERTVRHQAQEIYRKAGLAGRTEFAAFFLEDLLVPATRPNVALRSPANAPA